VGGTFGVTMPASAWTSRNLFDPRQLQGTDMEDKRAARLSF
jgi:hypothetical protein